MPGTTKARPRAEEREFTRYVEARQQSLLGFAVLLVGNRHDAEDLLQSVLGRACLKWDHLLARDVDLDAYVRAALVNARYSLWRRAFHRRERSTDELPVVVEDQAANDLDLWSRVLDLPERQRHVVALRYYEGLSVAETAAVMGSSEGTVKSQCSRALSRLRVVLSEEEQR